MTRTAARDSSAAIVAGSLALASFYVLLASLPRTLAEHGVPDVAASAATALVTGGAVVSELVVARIARRIGDRRALTTGLAAMAIGSAAITLTDRTPIVLAACAARGLGFGAAAVIASATVGRSAAMEDVGRAMARYGVATGLAGIVAVPLGVAVAGEAGGRAPALCALAFVVPALASCRKIADRPAGARTAAGMVPTCSRPQVWRPLVVFMAAASLAGAVATFFPIAFARHGNAVAAMLLVHTVATTLARGLAGHLRLEHHPRLGLVGATVVAATGVVSLALGTLPAAVFGLVALGAGFGLSQNLTITLMYRAVPETAYAAVSGLWNAGYDLALGVGAVAYAAIPGSIGSSARFLVLALVAAASLTATRDARSRDGVRLTTAGSRRPDPELRCGR